LKPTISVKKIELRFLAKTLKQEEKKEGKDEGTMGRSRYVVGPTHLKKKKNCHTQTEDIKKRMV